MANANDEKYKLWLVDAKTNVLPKKAHENHTQRNSDCVAATNAAIRGMIKRFGAKVIYLDSINHRLRLAYVHLPCYDNVQTPLITGEIEADNVNSNCNDNTNNDDNDTNDNDKPKSKNKSKNNDNSNSNSSNNKRKNNKKTSNEDVNGEEITKKSKRTKIIENDKYERNDDINRVFSLYHYEGKLEFIKESLNHSLKIISAYQGVDISKCQKPPKTSKEYNFKAVNWYNQQRTKISGVLAKDFLQQFKLRYIAPNVKPMFQGILTVSVIAEILLAKTHFPQTKQCDTVHGEGLHDGKLREWINSELSDLRLSIEWPKLGSKKTAKHYGAFKMKVIDELEHIYDDLETAILKKLRQENDKDKNAINDNSSVMKSDGHSSSNNSIADSSNDNNNNNNNNNKSNMNDNNGTIKHSIPSLNENNRSKSKMEASSISFTVAPRNDTTIQNGKDISIFGSSSNASFGGYGPQRGGQHNHISQECRFSGPFPQQSFLGKIEEDEEIFREFQEFQTLKKLQQQSARKRRESIEKAQLTQMQVFHPNDASFLFGFNNLSNNNGNNMINTMNLNSSNSNNQNNNHNNGNNNNNNNNSNNNNNNNNYGSNSSGSSTYTNQNNGNGSGGINFGSYNLNNNGISYNSMDIKNFGMVPTLSMGMESRSVPLYGGEKEGIIKQQNGDSKSLFGYPHSSASPQTRFISHSQGDLFVQQSPVASTIIHQIQSQQQQQQQQQQHHHSPNNDSVTMHHTHRSVSQQQQQQHSPGGGIMNETESVNNSVNSSNVSSITDNSFGQQSSHGAYIHTPSSRMNLHHNDTHFHFGGNGVMNGIVDHHDDGGTAVSLRFHGNDGMMAQTMNKARFEDVINRDEQLLQSLSTNDFNFDAKSGISGVDTLSTAFSFAGAKAATITSFGNNYDNNINNNMSFDLDYNSNNNNDIEKREDKIAINNNNNNNHNNNNNIKYNRSNKRNNDFFSYGLAPTRNDGIDFGELMQRIGNDRNDDNNGNSNNDDSNFDTPNITGTPCTASGSPIVIQLAGAVGVGVGGSGNGSGGDGAGARLESLDDSHHGSHGGGLSMISFDSVEPHLQQISSHVPLSSLTPQLQAQALQQQQNIHYQHETQMQQQQQQEQQQQEQVEQQVNMGFSYQSVMNQNGLNNMHHYNINNSNNNNNNNSHHNNNSNIGHNNTFLGMPMSTDSLDAGFGLNNNGFGNVGNNSSFGNIYTNTGMDNHQNGHQNNQNMNNINNMNNMNESASPQRLTSLLPGLNPGNVDFNDQSLSQLFSKSLSIN